jgi:hypothetical protein
MTKEKLIEIAKPKTIHGWKARVVHKASGREWKYWMPADFLHSVEDVRRHIEMGFSQVLFLEAWPANRPAQQELRPVPDNHFQCGALEAAKRELGYVPQSSHLQARQLKGIDHGRKLTYPSQWGSVHRPIGGN